MKKTKSKVGTATWELRKAIEVLRENGVMFVPQTAAGRRIKYYSREEVADTFGMSVDWVKVHRDEDFPHWIRVSGGDIRIPLEDVEAAKAKYFATRNQHTISIKRTGPAKLSVTVEGGPAGTFAAERRRTAVGA